MPGAAAPTCCGGAGPATTGSPDEPLAGGGSTHDPARTGEWRRSLRTAGDGIDRQPSGRSTGS